MEVNQVAQELQMVKEQVLSNHFAKINAALTKEAGYSVDGNKDLREQLLEEYQDVFDKKDKPLRPMEGKPMKIQLQEDAEPYHVNAARPIPYPHRHAAEMLIKDMVNKGILEQVSQPTEWLHAMTIVPKANGDLRLTVDLRATEQVREAPDPSHSLTKGRSLISGQQGQVLRHLRCLKRLLPN